jgi:hypothetical protein
MTWDLKTNNEYSLVDIDVSGISSPEHLLCKGIYEKLNYLVTSNEFYDFQYLLPLKFIKA